MTPFPKLRREAKHDARHRQLPVLVLLLVFPRVLAETPAGPSLPEELRAAKLLETALLARDPSAEGASKLERIYAGLSAKYPRDATVKNAHGEFLWSLGEPARAVEMWEAAAAIDPKNAVVLDHLASHWLALGEIRKSAGLYARAVSSAPGNAAYHFAYANVTFLFRHELLSDAQPNEEAVLRHSLANFAEASRLAPLNAEYARAYAETFYNLPNPDWKAALAAWQYFAGISPRTDFAQANLARIHLKLGQLDAARTCLERIQGADFQNLKARLSERLTSARSSSAASGQAPVQPPAAAKAAPDFSRKPGIDEPGEPP